MNPDTPTRQGDGIGCHCYANSYHECGCPDADWTPSEVYELQDQLAASQAEVERLRKYVEKLEIYSPENEWSQPEWRKLIGSKDEHEDPETLFQLYQFRLAPEWRELGKDEEIHTGDECILSNDEGAGWSNCISSVGDKPEDWEGLRFRTRRPLPKQEQERPLLKVMDYCRKWADEHLAGHGKETFYARLGLLVDFATDLYRDEIENLKKNQK